MKQVKIFDRTHNYDRDWEVKSDIEIVKKIKEEICKPQILNYSGLNTIDLYVPDNSLIWHDCIWWIYEQNKQSDEDIRACLLRCSDEDKEWTAWRNKDLSSIFYRKITFLPAVQGAVCKVLDEYLDELNTILGEFSEQKAETEKQKQEWSVTNVYKDVEPADTEDGADGYYDADYTSQNGDVVRMVIRNVFDFGVVIYPKRFEGTDNATDTALWSAPEKQLAIWISKFGKYQNARM